jgi:hypothetical protein
MAASYVVVAVMGPATMPTLYFNGLMTSARMASISEVERESGVAERGVQAAPI